MNANKNVIGIDVGGSTTKIVGFDGKRLLEPGLVKANDPIASVYGGFGKFTNDNKITLSDIEKVTFTPIILYAASVLVMIIGTIILIFLMMQLLLVDII